MAHIILEGAVNLTPIFKVLLYVGVVGFFLFALFWIGFFILHALGAAIGFFRGSGDQFGAIVVFWGGLAIVAALVALAFTHRLVAFE